MCAQSFCILLFKHDCVFPKRCQGGKENANKVLSDFLFFAEANLSFGLKLISADSVVYVFVYFSSLTHLWKL